MAGLSTYMENNVLNWFKGTTFPAAPTTLYVALLTTMPSADDGTGAVEVSGGSYARIAVTTSTGWTAISSKTIKNVNALTYANPTANWGTIVGTALLDASSSGNWLSLASLDYPVTISSGGKPFVFAANSLSFVVN